MSVGAVEKARKKIQATCTHPEIAGTGHGEGLMCFSSVTWRCTNCVLPMTDNVPLKKGTILLFYSKAILKRDRLFGQISEKDQKWCW